jgi:protein phosphatase
MKFLNIFSKTDIGKKRENNEDSVISIVMHSQSFSKELNYGILVVADGMGGREMGEVASDIASKKFIEKTVQSILLASEKSRKINFSHILLRSVKFANNEVFKLLEGKTKPAGTTLVGAIIVDNHIYIVNVGDSRAYLVKPNETITQITKDHSAVQELLDNKIITKEQAKNHPRRNILTKAIGLAKEVIPDIYEEEMKDRTLLLCSDGLYSMVDEDEIAKTISGNIYDGAEELISLANKYGGLDNISVAMARIE